MKFLSAAVALLLIGYFSAGIGIAADHLEAPAVMGNGDVDLNDLFIFESPTNANNVVLALTVNPFAGNISGTTFRSDPGTSYQFQIDNTGDAVADITYSARFTAAVNGVQSVSFTRTEGLVTSVLGSGQTDQNISLTGGSGFAGLSDDPFFFDLEGFNDGFNFTGTDTFAGANVSSIVLELDKNALLVAGGDPALVGVQAVTTVDDMQFDRMGRPAVATVLVPEGRKDEFNTSSVENDFANFGDDVSDTILSLNGGDSTAADSLTSVLLPDLLTFDITDSSGFLNGRRLDDDVIDGTLALVTDGGLTSDGVDANDQAFRSVFPFVAAPNVAAVPEPSAMAVMLMTGVGLAIRRRRQPVVAAIA